MGMFILNMKSSASFIAVFFILQAGWSNGTFAQPISVVDDRNTVVKLKAPAQRVVSMLPSLTESVCALGKCSVLVGVDRFSNWPKSVDGLPRLGGIADANIEGIVRLKPDLVLVEKSSPLIILAISQEVLFCVLAIVFMIIFAVL